MRTPRAFRRLTSCDAVCVSGDGASATDEARQHAEADATGDHGRGAQQQERGLGGAGLRQFLLGLALLDRLRARTVGVGARAGVTVDHATVGVGVVATVRPAVVVATVVVATVSTAVGTAVSATVSATVSTTVSTAVSTTIGTAVSTTIGTAVSTAVSATIGTAVSTAVSTTIGTAIGATIGTAVSTTIGTAVSTTIGATIGTAVSTTIGTAVSTTIGATVSTAVSTTIGTAVSTTIGTAVSTTIGTAVSTTIGTAVSTTIGATVDTTRVAVDADTGVDAVLVGVGGHLERAHVDVERLRGTCGGQRRTRGDHGAGGYTRDANPRLLRHLAATPSSFSSLEQRPEQQQARVRRDSPARTRPGNTHAARHHSEFWQHRQGRCGRDARNAVSCLTCGDATVT
ncbi:hypothetical protein [Streptomyces sp. t39]|uniref:hypothetical protein n=1 Tax=Streptomyces sp. t39 TaxID=1828156 RepID=UPI001650BAF7|nr:hypothetical protein [Streptomyces sp. t39]